MKIPVRFWIGLMVFLTTYITYTTRVNMGVSIISMTKGKAKKIPECLNNTSSKEENPDEENPDEEKPGTEVLPDYGPRYDWDETVQGQILGSYFWGYIITSLPGGAVAEWWGPHKTILWMTVISCLLQTASVPAAWTHFGLLMFCRFCLGFCGGFVYPALQALIANWAPPAEKGKFVSALMGNTLSTCLTWPLIGLVTTEFGWDWGFYFISFQILVFCVIFWIVAADRPEDHGFISAEEVNYIKDAQAGSVGKQRPKTPYLALFTSIPFWILAILHFGNLWGLYLQLQSVPKYLADVIGFNLKEAGFISALPHLTRLFFGLAYGMIGDFLKKINVSPVIIRKSFVMMSHIIPGILLIFIAFSGCEWLKIMIYLILSMAINGAAVLTNLQNPHDLAPNFAGTIFGIISFLGGVTGFIVPAITAVFIQDHNGVREWGYIFILGGSVYICTGVVFMLFGSVKEQRWNRIEAE